MPTGTAPPPDGEDDLDDDLDTEPPPRRSGGTPGWDFFVSYTQADEDWAEWIAWQLEAAGYQVLLQVWDMVPGNNWTIAMREGMQRADRTLAVLSPAYLASTYGRTEWQAAYEADQRGFERKLIPVRVVECDRPGVLGEIVSFDLFGLSAEKAKALLLRKVDVIRSGRAKPLTEPTFPPDRTPS